MIGIYPSNNITFEVEGNFDSTNLIEGRLYFNNNGRLFMYSTKEKRSSPKSAFLPIWDGVHQYTSKFSVEKFIDKDVTLFDINSLSSSINKDVANNILYKHRLSINSELLDPKIADEDNMFTQCIKSIIRNKEITLCDLIDMGQNIGEKNMMNYYLSLNKITFMRYDKWCVWLDAILHIKYIMMIYKNDKKLLEYEYPINTFNTGNVKFDSAINKKDDPFKNIIKILLLMENINKNLLKSKEVDDYTINNLFTTLNGKKPLSAQLFDRFIRISNLSYIINFYDINDDKIIFTYLKT